MTGWMIADEWLTVWYSISEQDDEEYEEGDYDEEDRSRNRKRNISRAKYFP